jgi:hypothetical protein
MVGIMVSVTSICLDAGGCWCRRGVKICGMLAGTKAIIFRRVGATFLEPQEVEADSVK